jgi:glycerol kinase
VAVTRTGTKVLVIDVGTSGLRAVVVDGDARILHQQHRALPPATPGPGIAEFDPVATSDTAIALGRSVLAAAGGVDAVAVTNQRSSTVLWDRRTGRPLGPGLGWQDQRTLPRCEQLLAKGLLIPPNLTATKAAWLLEHANAAAPDVCVGTIDSWIVWQISGGVLHVTDPSNACATGLTRRDGSEWDAARLEATGVPRATLPAIVDSSGVMGHATVFDGAPPIAGIAGDQQASLIGQGCVRRGLTKITFGSGAMLNLCLGTEEPSFDLLGKGGSGAIVAWRKQGSTAWALEGDVLSAGTSVEWLRDGLGLIADYADADVDAAECASSERVLFVPALVGLGTPQWNFRARGAFLGLSPRTTRPQLVRAVLEGIAQRAADLVEAAEADGGVKIAMLRIDGGMSTNRSFVQAVADATGCAIEVSPVTEATSLGAAFLAGLAIGALADWEDVAATWRPRARVEPRRSFDRARWKEACQLVSNLRG